MNYYIQSEVNGARNASLTKHSPRQTAVIQLGPPLKDRLRKAPQLPPVKTPRN